MTYKICFCNLITQVITLAWVSSKLCCYLNIEFTPLKQLLEVRCKNSTCYVLYVIPRIHLFVILEKEFCPYSSCRLYSTSDALRSQLPKPIISRFTLSPLKHIARLCQEGMHKEAQTLILWQVTLLVAWQTQV